MGKVSDDLKKANAGADDHAFLEERARQQSVNVHDDNLSGKKEALEYIAEELRPLFDELRDNPKTMFLLPNFRVLKMGTTDLVLTTAEHDHVHVKDPVLMCLFGQCDSDPLKNVGQHSVDYGKGGNERVLISYDTDQAKYKIQEQSVWIKEGDLSSTTEYDWTSFGEEKLLDHAETKDYMKERLVDVLAHHKRALPARLSKVVVAGIVAFGISHFVGDANAETLADVEDLYPDNVVEKRVDIPARDLSVLDV